MQTCHFGTAKDSLVRDRIVCGIQNLHVRESDLMLEKNIQICRAAELSRENVKTLEGRNVEEVHAVRNLEQAQGARPKAHLNQPLFYLMILNRVKKPALRSGLARVGSALTHCAP